MANIFNYNILNVPLIGGYGAGGSAASVALSSDFVLGTSGACVGVRFNAPGNGSDVDCVYFFLHTEDSSAQNLTCHICDYGSSATLAGASIKSVVASGGTTASKWIKFDFSADRPALTAGEVYWAVVGDAAGNGDTYAIRTRNSSHATTGVAGTAGTGAHLALYYSNDGFASNTTAASYPITCIIKFDDGTLIGHPYTQVTADASNALERGLLVTGLTEQLKIAGICCTQTLTNLTTFQIYSGTTAPAGSVWSGFNGGSAYTLSTEEKAIGAFWFPSVVTLAKDTTYRFTFKYDGNRTYPGYNEVQDAATPGADATNCCLGQSRFCYTIDDTAGGWTDYNNHTTGLRLPRMSLIVYDQVAIASGGIMSHPGMTGGMNG